MADESTPPELAADAQPVTLVIKRRVKPSQEAHYEEWLQRFQAEARNMPGSLA